jgi:FkbM family methyltransferase
MNKLSKLFTRVFEQNIFFDLGRRPKDSELMSSRLDQLFLKIEELKTFIAQKPEFIFANDTEILVENDTFFFAFPSDEVNHALSFLNFSFDIGLRRFIGYHATSGGVYLDIGSNVGVMCAVAARQIGSQGLVISVDPIPKMTEFVARNIALNCPHTNHKHYACAIGKESEKRELQLVKGDNRVSTLYQYEEANIVDRSINIEVEVKTVEDVLPLGKSSYLIKIDAEGAEFYILKDLFALLCKEKVIEAIVIFEFAVEHFNRAETDPNDLIDLLELYKLQARYINPVSGVLEGQF